MVSNYFPSQAVSDLEKISYEYGLKVAQAIQSEWFYDNNASYGTGSGTNSRYYNYQNNFHRLRLYARGDQPVQKYKDELSINGDLSYLNLDWKPVPIIPKFVDIVVNGIAERTYDIKAYSQDPFGVQKRTEYMTSILKDMQTSSLKDYVSQNFGVNLYENDPDTLPQSNEELQLHMQLNYKQQVEIAEEQAINYLLEGNKYELIKKRFYYDLATIGIGAVKTHFNTSDGVKVDYVDPADLVYSYTESPYFEDIYYVGEVKNIPINELAKQFPHLQQEDMEEIAQKNNQYVERFRAHREYDNNKVQVLYFNYKTYMNDVYKIKQTATGADKVIQKDDTFNPPESKEGDYSRLHRQVEVLYEGALILGTDKLIQWQLCPNMLRSKSEYGKVKMNYHIVAPRMYKGKIESLVDRITGFADMIQLTHLKLQQVMSRMVPDGVYMDADALAEIDLGNGTNYNPQEALNMFFQTGSVIGRSMTADGDVNPGRVPIKEIQSGSGNAKLASLIQTYNYYLQMMRDVTGLNEARDGSTPDKNALVGVQKLAAANSNTATRHILQSGLFLTAEVAEALSLRISDIIEYSPTAEALISSIGAHNVSVLDEMSELHLYDFGIFIDLAPDEEEKARLENNIQVALSQKTIELEDAIDIREIKNASLANQMLKLRRQKKEQKDQAKAERNMQVQAQINNQSSQAAAAAEVQKQQALTQQKAQLAQMQASIDAQKMRAEADVKKELMQLEFQMNSQLKMLEVEALKGREKEKEDRKDERTKIQASQQSELIEQRKTGGSPKKFESSSDDILGLGALDI